MNVRHFMTKNVVRCDVADPVEHAARLMREKGVGFVVVEREGKITGVLTDRDIVTRLVAIGKSAMTAAEEVMTPNPATVSLVDNLFTVVDTLRSAGVVRRLPVVDSEGACVGIVSVSDLAVIAKDLIDAVLLEDTHHALTETREMTGGKSIRKTIRAPRRSVSAGAR